MKQPGSWLYSILPYIDQLPLFQMSASDPTQSTARMAEQPQYSGREKHVHDPADLHELPDAAVGGGLPDKRGFTIHQPAPGTGIVKGDYAANAGDMQYPDSFRVCGIGPTSLAQGDQWTANPGPGQSGADVRPSMLISTGQGMPLAWGPTPYNGIVFQRSEVTMAMVSDGTSNTYLVGEKYCVPNYYATGDDTADTEPYYCGDDNDNQRTGWSQPMQDTPDYYPGTMATISMYGSAHDSGINMAFCDGSVHQISYTIDSHIPGGRALAAAKATRK